MEPLKFLKEKWLTEINDMNLLDYVSDFKEKLHGAFKLAKENLINSQNKMKSRYNEGIFKQCDKILVFLPIPSHPLQAKYFDPYEIEKKISDLNCHSHPRFAKKEENMPH